MELLSGPFLLHLLSPLQARSPQSYQGLGVNRPSEITDVSNKYLSEALMFVEQLACD